MKVKALRMHQNRYGDNFEKQAGDTYSLPDSEGRRLVNRGWVEKIDDEGAEDKRTSRDGKGAGAASEGDGKERASAGGKEGAGADAGKSRKSGAG